jgi:hypothetical protein
MPPAETKKIVLAVDDMPLNLAVIRTIPDSGYDIRLARPPVAAWPFHCPTAKYRNPSCSTARRL